MKSIVRQELEDLKFYEPGKPIFEVEKELGVKEVIKLASNEAPHPPFREALAAIKESFNEINRYPDGECTLLREKLATLLKIRSENFIFGHGSNELVRLLAQVALNPGEEVLMGNPSFTVYPTVTKIAGGIPKEIPLKGHRLDLEAMFKAVSKKTKIVFIANPNNPTGTIVTRSEVEEFLEKIPPDVLVVFDEAYFEYVEDLSCPDALNFFRQGKTVAILRTFSKIYSLAGLRIGYGIVPKEVALVVNKVREPFNVNLLAQVAALASLDFFEELERRKILNRVGKSFLYQEFKKLGLKFILSEANFVLVNTGRDSREVFKKLLQEGVIVRTGDIFGKGYETFIRVTVGIPQENQKFIQALRKALKTVRSR